MAQAMPEHPKPTSEEAPKDSGVDVDAERRELLELVAVHKIMTEDRTPGELGYSSDDVEPETDKEAPRTFFSRARNRWAVGTAAVLSFFGGAYAVVSGSGENSDPAGINRPVAVGEQNPGADTGSNEAARPEAPVNSPSGGVESGQEAREVIVEIDGIFIDGKESQLRPIYDSIDWSTRETILATAPEPMYVTPNEDGKVNAQDAADAWTFNSSIWNTTNDPRYGAAMTGSTDTSSVSDSSYYMTRINGNYGKIIQWVTALNLSEGENGVVISGQGVNFREEIGLDGLEIGGFKMSSVVAGDTVESSGFEWSSDNLFELFNYGSNPYEIEGHGTIQFPWQGYTGPALTP